MIFGAVLVILLVPETTTLCELPGYVIESTTYGFLQSPGYPNSSANTPTNSCHVTLTVPTPISVEFVVDGMFYIPTFPSNSTDCFWRGRRFEISSDSKNMTVCGYHENGSVIAVVEDSSSPGRSTDIRISFTYSEWGDSEAYFRIKYSGM